MAEYLANAFKRLTAFGYSGIVNDKAFYRLWIRIALFRNTAHKLPTNC
jgi:hypothetical protein